MEALNSTPLMRILLRVRPTLPLILAGIIALGIHAAAAAEPRVLVGAARIDITPDGPIRLAGYQGGARMKETERIEGRLFARALAIGADDQQPAVLITADVVGVSAEISHAVADALRQSHAIPRERVAVCATHTHAGPAIQGVLPFMFAEDVPAAERARIERFTATLQKKLIRVATEALAARQPGTLAWGEGKVTFATQRRKVVDGKYLGFGVFPEGMADHTLPVLRVTDERGAVRAVFTSYACHCTTLRGSDHFVHPDWAGDAAGRLEAAHPNAISLVAIGCGGDVNPSPRAGLADVPRHGAALAAEVERVLGGALRPLGPLTSAAYRQIELPLGENVTRADLEKRLEHERPLIRYSASKHLAVLDSGAALPTRVPYPVQTWAFGDALAMVFLGGEVVSEYSLRLRRELAPQRLWVNAYANSVPCYIASRRMFDEGGYEVDASMNYYGWPSPLAPTIEDQIIATVHALLPRGFRR